MPTLRDPFEVELDGETAVITPTRSLPELDFQEIEAAADKVLNLLSRAGARNVVADLRRMDWCGSTVLGFFVRLSRMVRLRSGRMAFCNVSEHEDEILALANLEGVWPVCASKEDAIRAVGG
jgi:anti-anti-sigma factor